MFITFEGIEGSGKSTLARSTAAALQQAGIPVLLTREPGGSALGTKIRALLLNAEESVSPRAELFLFLADRTQHVDAVIKPALDKGTVVLCDRFTDSTIAYQGFGRGLDIGLLDALNANATGGLVPDLTIVADLQPQIGLERAKKRNAENGTATSEGRFEDEELAFHAKIRNGFLAIAESHPERVMVLDASMPPDELASKAIELILKRFSS
ncbi:MAG: dTMP kinase [Mailhella sp.]|nr:dTMP kinase [Mailhella sp.]